LKPFFFYLATKSKNKSFGHISQSIERSGKFTKTKTIREALVARRANCQDILTRDFHEYERKLQRNLRVLCVTHKATGQG
jgi:hypothetical protein